MKTLLQLLKEFWLPLLLAVAWTTFNVVDKPSASWTVREVLNVFAPTFFFMTWLVAQWYRVRKQQRVEAGLSDIQAGVEALQEPLLPCGAFITLELNATNDDLARVFGSQAGYHSFGPHVAMPEPPVGLPTGMRDGRVFSPNGYLDYRNGVLAAAGSFRLKHPGFNTIHREVTHTVSYLDANILADAESKNEPLLAKPSICVEVFLNGKPTSEQVKPSLVLKSSMSNAIEVVAACAFDNTVFVDLAVRSLSPAPAVGSSWSVGSLRGAFIRVTLDFFYVEGIAALVQKSWPRLHNFQLWLGGTARRVLTFTIEQLSEQVTRENPRPIAVGMAVCPQIMIEFEIDAGTFATSLLSVT